MSNQGRVEGQTLQVNVGDYANAASLGRLLKGLEFPIDKYTIIQLVQLQEPINISKQKKEELLHYTKISMKESDTKMFLRLLELQG